MVTGSSALGATTRTHLKIAFRRLAWFPSVQHQYHARTQLVLRDDPHDPENAKRLDEAAQFRHDNPNGLIIHHVIVSPPNGEPNWERYILFGNNVQIAKAQVLAREVALEEAMKAASMRQGARNRRLQGRHPGGAASCFF